MVRRLKIRVFAFLILHGFITQYAMYLGFFREKQKRVLEQTDLRAKRGREGLQPDLRETPKRKREEENQEDERWMVEGTVRGLLATEVPSPIDFVWDAATEATSVVPNKMWQAVCNVDIGTTASAIRESLAVLSRAPRSIDRCLPGISVDDARLCVSLSRHFLGFIISGLPNVSCVGLQRALTLHLKSIKVPALRVTLAIYAETGLCRGWGLIEPTTWSSIPQLLSSPQFEWRGVATKLRPLTCPHLVHLNCSIA